VLHVVSPPQKPVPMTVLAVAVPGVGEGEAGHHAEDERADQVHDERPEGEGSARSALQARIHEVASHGAERACAADR
jgi:hypothetical protein